MSSLHRAHFSYLCGSSPNKEDWPEFHNKSWRLWYSSLRYSLNVLMDSKCLRCNRSSSNHVGSSFKRPNENVFWYVESKMSAPIARYNKEALNFWLHIIYFDIFPILVIIFIYPNMFLTFARHGNCHIHVDINESWKFFVRYEFECMIRVHEVPKFNINQDYGKNPSSYIHWNEKW